MLTGTYDAGGSVVTTWATPMVIRLGGSRRQLALLNNTAGTRGCVVLDANGSCPPS